MEIWGAVLAEAAIKPHTVREVRNLLDTDDAVFVRLATGWCFVTIGCHLLVCDRAGNAQKLFEEVHPCRCDRCTKS